VRPAVAETTALGACYAAGLAVGFFEDLAEVAALWGEDRRWEPAMEVVDRERFMAGWERAVSRSLGWVDETE